MIFDVKKLVDELIPNDIEILPEDITPEPYEIAQMIWSLNDEELAKFIKIMSEDEEPFSDKLPNFKDNLKYSIAKNYSMNDRKKATYYFLDLAGLILEIEQEQS